MRNDTHELAGNVKVFVQRWAELLREQRGKFAVIGGGEFIGAYPSYEEALTIGYQRYGREPFLVKQVLPQEDEIMDFHAACRC